MDSKSLLSYEGLTLQVNPFLKSTGVIKPQQDHSPPVEYVSGFCAIANVTDHSGTSAPDLNSKEPYSKSTYLSE